MSVATKVIVIGLDGLEPTIVEPMLARGELPNLARMRHGGGYARCRTTLPAQTPVAWSTFATGVNPGGHGIFDFIRRDPATYLPDLALNRYERASSFLPPRAVNLRRGVAVWDVLSAAGIPSTILRCPCTYPPSPLQGRMLAGMGVPDVRGALGTSTFYASADGVAARESESLIPVRLDANGTGKTHLIGPRHPKSREDVKLEMLLEVDSASRTAVVRTSGQPSALELREGVWSDWLRVKFKFGVLQHVSGLVRFLLVRTEPVLELYASPVNFDPRAPAFPISHPWEYAAELERETGTFYTTGMVEDTTGLNNDRFDEEQFLDQCSRVLRERERMMCYELDRLHEGLFFCLFDTPDRLQHMFWRFREPEHPANVGRPVGRWTHAIEEHYRACDLVVGQALARADDRTLTIVLSDHGFGSFQRGVHLNGWLHAHGLLSLKSGVSPGDDAGDFLRSVDWSRTKAYALGLGSLYLNIEGREAEGIVKPGEVDGLGRDIASALAGLRDDQRGRTAVSAVVTRDDAYSGPYASESPDLVTLFNPGYRVSWTTALGGVGAGLFEDNTKRWGGDHIVDPARVPGVLFMNRRFSGERARLLDLAPTILSALGVPKGAVMEGESLLS